MQNRTERMYEITAYTTYKAIRALNAAMDVSRSQYTGIQTMP